MPPSDPGPQGPDQLRISDQERHAVAEVLRDAAGEGRITLEELEERLEATYAARTYADLVPLTADLPLAGRPFTPEVLHANLPVVRPSGTPATYPSYDSSFAVMSETKRSGHWQVGPSHTAFSLMGSVVIDLRQAQFTSREVILNANTVMGSIEVIVDAHTQVVVEGAGVMGDFSEGRAKIPYEPHPQAPVLRVRGVALMGAVEVKRQAPPGTKRGKRPR